MIHFSESVNCKQLALFGTPKYLLIKKCNKTLEYTGWLENLPREAKVGFQ
jgi:hypothetical protein